MSKKSKIIISLINIIISLFIILSLFSIMVKLELYIKIIVTIVSILLAISNLVFIFLKKDSLIKTSFLLNCLMAIIVIIFNVLYKTGLFENFSDVENIKMIIKNAGIWGYLVCFLIILFQIVILPIPAIIVYIAISSIYGSFIGFLICYISTVISSFIAFLIGKKAGKKAVSWCIGEESTEKYSKLLSKKGKLPFVMMQLMPMFPDDILCMVAGLSSMSCKFFIICMILIKPIYIGFVCFLGKGQLIPFSGWGIPVWIIIIIILILICILYFKYQDNIDSWLKKKYDLIFKRKNNHHKNS